MPGAGEELLREGLLSIGIEPSDMLVADFGTFLDELMIWNGKTNLVGTENRAGIIVRHVFDSLTVYPLLREMKGPILDIGAGAGFPSIPLAIVDPRGGAKGPPS